MRYSERIKKLYSANDKGANINYNRDVLELEIADFLGLERVDGCQRHLDLTDENGFRYEVKGFTGCDCSLGGLYLMEGNATIPEIIETFISGIDYLVIYKGNKWEFNPLGVSLLSKEEARKWLLKRVYISVTASGRNKTKGRQQIAKLKYNELTQKKRAQLLKDGWL